MSLKPETRTIRGLFTQPYLIDFYQREYKWTEGHVTTLLDDIFFKFDQHYREHVDVTVDTVSRFGWYYLNTIVTNQVDGKRYVVDGQQRLTTLTLILLALYHLAQEHDLGEDPIDLLKQRIYGTDVQGKAYWMGADGRAPLLESILRDGSNAKLSEQQSQRITLRNIHANYSLIHGHLARELAIPHRLQAFILYFLTRVELVEILIDDARDVAMVFEVINDRGEPLRPYEVLKGQLLSQLDKIEIEETYYRIWQDGISRILELHPGDPARADGEADAFFQTYFRSKYTNTRSEYRDFESEYQRTILQEKWSSKLQLKRNPDGVKSFLRDRFSYYSRLYADLAERRDTEGSLIYFSTTLNDLDRLFLLLLSAIEPKDPDELEKVDLISRLFDRHFSLLRLTGSYDTNRFTEIIITLNSEIRERSVREIRQVFDRQLLNDIGEAHEITIHDPFDYRLFANVGYDSGSRFLRYFFARAEHFIAEHCHEPAKGYYDLVRNNGQVNGHHIEHVIADNEENRSMVLDSEGNPDEEGFLRLRNRLGALVLLKGRDNLSSNNEPYRKKLRTYSHGPLIARTLTSDFYHKNPDFQDFISREGLPFTPYPTFDTQAVDERHKLYFELAKRIWGDASFPLSRE